MNGKLRLHWLLLYTVHLMPIVSVGRTLSCKCINHSIRLSPLCASVYSDALRGLFPLLPLGKGEGVHSCCQQHPKLVNTVDDRDVRAGNDTLMKALPINTWMGEGDFVTSNENKDEEVRTSTRFRSPSSQHTANVARGHFYLEYILQRGKERRAICNLKNPRLWSLWTRVYVSFL